MSIVISVLLPVYNEFDYVDITVGSVLSQTFSDFELLLIDDSENSEMNDKLISIANSDSRIKLLKNDKNIGLISSLNRGIREAKGKYIARIDADDIMNIDRLQMQVDFLEKNKSVVIVGSGCNIIDEDGKFQKYVSPILDERKIESIGCFRNPFFHPTVTIRKNILDDVGGYDPTWSHIEDMELWLRILSKGNGVNLDVPLIDYRVHSNSVTTKFNRFQRKQAVKLIVKKFFLFNYSNSCELYYMLLGFVKSCVFLLLPNLLLQYIREKRN